MNNKICVLYHYYEKDENYIDNLKHFLKFGIAGNADYYIILAGGYCSIDIANLDNLTVFCAANKNFDYGGYSEAFLNIVDSEKYDFFIFLNSSVRGPFIPPYSLDEKKWFEYFLDLFDDSVGIVGASINILGKGSFHYENYERIFRKESLLAHVQTPVFALSKESFKMLDDINFFSVNNEWSRDEVISRYEINLSRVLLDGGWNLKSLLPEFNQFDYRLDDLDKKIPDYMLGDILIEGGYLGRTVHPYEVMFVKTGRGLWPTSYLEVLSSAMSLSRGANLRCLSDFVSIEVVSSNAQFFKKKESFSRRFYRYLRLSLRR